MKKINFLIITTIIFLTGCFNEANMQNKLLPIVNEVTTNDAVHKTYLQLMESNRINCKKQNGKFENIYTFFDIDKDGIEELIVCGYHAYRIYTLKEDELVMLISRKYGAGRIRIYPNQGIVFFSSGHMDYYSDVYIKIKNFSAEIIAKKKWKIKHISKSKSKIINKYELRDFIVSKAEYNTFEKSLKSDEMVKHAKLEWMR